MRFLCLFICFLTGISSYQANAQGCDKCCDTRKLLTLEENLERLSESDIEAFLYTFDGRCRNNAEYAEMSNEVLYALLCSEKAELLISVLSQNDALPIQNIRREIESPIHDGIDVQKAYSNVEKIAGPNAVKDAILQSIGIAIAKYKNPPMYTYTGGTQLNVLIMKKTNLRRLLSQRYRRSTYITPCIATILH